MSQRPQVVAEDLLLLQGELADVVLGPPGIVGASFASGVADATQMPVHALAHLGCKVLGVCLHGPGQFGGQEHVARAGNRPVLAL